MNFDAHPVKPVEVDELDRLTQDLARAPATE
jgi:hypothetical protein